MCKQLAVVSTKQVPYFNPSGKEDLEWSMVIHKPRCSTQMEIGVFCFIPQRTATKGRGKSETGIQGEAAHDAAQ